MAETAVKLQVQTHQVLLFLLGVSDKLISRLAVAMSAAGLHAVATLVFCRRALIWRVASTGVPC